MNIHSTGSASILNHVMNNTSKASTKNIEAEQKEIDNEIQSLQQKKSTLEKEINNIKNDFAPPKPKDEMIRPLKEQIQILDKQIQQKQMEKTKIQNEKTKEGSCSDNNKKSNLATKDIEYKDKPGSTKEKNKSDIELLKNFTTQTGVRNEAKMKNDSKNSAVLSPKEINFSDTANTSDSIKSIAEKKKQKDIENAIAAYKAIENNSSINSETNLLS